jgi:hypothetical protein
MSTRRNIETVTSTSVPEPPPLRRPVPGRLFALCKIASWIELGLFAALLFFWLAPGFEHETFIFGLSHGIGYIALCLLILLTVVRREAPWPLLRMGACIAAAISIARNTVEALLAHHLLMQ